MTTSLATPDGALRRPIDQTPSPRRRPRRVAAKAWAYIALTAGLVLMVFPFVWMFLGAFKTEGELRQRPLTVWPQNPTLENFSELFARNDFFAYFANSIVVALFVTLGNILFCSMVGYALAKMRFRGRRLLFGLVIGMLMVPGVVTFVPQFVLVAKLGLVNTYPGLILPFLVTPIGVFLMRQFIGEQPDELIEAARLDGAGEFRIFFRVILPLCGPAIATLAILTFLGSWNNFLWPMVVSSTEDMYTLPVALALFSIGQFGVNYGVLMAGAVVVVTPILILFVFLQRYFTQGISMTGIK